MILEGWRSLQSCKIEAQSGKKLEKKKKFFFFSNFQKKARGEKCHA
jgi:hypothetical protein